MKIFATSLQARQYCVMASNKLTSPPSTLQTAFVYNGPGAGTRSVLSAIESLREALRPDIAVETIGTESLLSGHWTDRCVLLVMPGGADLPYCKHLNGKGTYLIRTYIEHGGSYLGLCAGAYFACSRVEFETGTPLEVVGDRELRVFNGIARGAVFRGFEYEGEGGSVPAAIQYRYLVDASGTSPSSFSEWRSTVDYVNGGPQFLNPDGSLALSTDDDTSSNSTNNKNASKNGIEERQQQQQQGKVIVPQGAFPTHILARYTHINNSAAALLCTIGLGRAVLCGSHPELSYRWLGQPAGSQRSDYVSSRTRSGTTSTGTESMDSGGDGMEDSVVVLGGQGGDTATVVAASPAVTTGSGSGIATNSNAGSDNDNGGGGKGVSNGGGGGVDDKEARIEELRSALQQSEKERWRYWCGLLAAAGLRQQLKNEHKELLV